MTMISGRPLTPRGVVSLNGRRDCASALLLLLLSHGPEGSPRADVLALCPDPLIQGYQPRSTGP